MSSFDRDAALKTAEKALRQGRIDAAIAEYLRIVEAQPRDWNSANTLGDLYVRANQPDKGVAQFAKIADRLSAEGFHPKAAALFKKILKIRPTDEHALVQSGEMAAKQGLLADARQFFRSVADLRRAKGDTQGSAQMVIRMGTLDPDDLDARLGAARAAVDIGDSATALREFRDLAERHRRAGRSSMALDLLADVVRLDAADVGARLDLARGFLAAGEVERAQAVVDSATAGNHPPLWLVLTELKVLRGREDEARAAAAKALALDASLRDALIEMAHRTAVSQPDAAYAALSVVVDADAARQEFGAAAAALVEFVGSARSHLIALMRLVDVCVDGRLDATMYEAQAQLADAYLEVGRGLEARIISEDLLSHDPANTGHVERFRRALLMLGETDPERIIEERLSGDSPFLMPEALDLNEGVFFDEPAARVAEPGPRSLEQVFHQLREEVGRSSDEEAAAEQYALALTYHDLGMTDDAIVALEAAARSPRQRFDAAALLGRVHLERGETAAGIEWLERAAEAPAATPDAGRALLYDLGQALESIGEHARAVAVFVELETETGGYRDVAARIDRLSKAQPKG